MRRNALLVRRSSSPALCSYILSLVCGGGQREGGGVDMNISEKCHGIDCEMIFFFTTDLSFKLTFLKDRYGL